MIDVGEETGELDVMLYKVADYYEEEVESITEGLMKMIEPLMIIFWVWSCCSSWRRCSCH